WPAPSWRRSPDSAPPAPPFAPGPVGAEARPSAARAPTPALCSASRRSASDPSSTVGHLPNGKVSCPNHAADSYPKLVLYNIPLHVVRDLVACRSEFVTTDAAGGVGVFPLDGPGIGGVGVDVAAEFASP